MRPDSILARSSKLVDQIEQMLRADQNLLQILFLQILDLPFGLAQHQAGKADDRIERRAQLVADVGEKLRLVFVGGFELLIFVLDFLEQANILDGDDGLVGEGLKQGDLLIGERLRTSSAGSR